MPLDDCGLAVLRDDRFKYVHCTALPPPVLDLPADPRETRNLATDPAYRHVRLDMAERPVSRSAGSCSGGRHCP